MVCFDINLREIMIQTDADIQHVNLPKKTDTLSLLNKAGGVSRWAHL